MKRFIIYILSLLFVVACTKFDNEISSASVTLGDEVAITLSIGVDGVTGEAEELPSITVRSEESNVDPEEPTESEDLTVSLIDDISSEVMNLWVVQFDGTSDQSKIISMSYIDKGEDLVNTTPTVNFVETPEATTILFLANTFDEELIPSLNYTLAAVKTLNYPVATNLEDVEVSTSNQLSYANGLATEDENGKKYFTMSCAIDYQILETQTDEPTTETTETETETTDPLSIKLLRNAVKLTFTLKNEWEGAKVTSISLRDASQMCYYYSSYLTKTDYPFPVSTSPVDYQTTTLSIEEGQSQTITLYAPVNIKGVETLSTLESKSYYAPSTSTYVYIEAIYNGAQTYNYTYYLGANLVDDYNLLPNYAYTYTLTFNEGGSADTDYTVESSEIDYTLREASNCYILNPSTQDDVIYYIPIQPRINEFWKDYAQELDKKSNRLNDNTIWDFVVLWYDNEESPICPAVWEDDIDVSIPETTQVKIERVDDHNDAPVLKVTLPKDFNNEGNMAVAVFDKDGNLTEANDRIVDGDILWSWHFWITDYNPDSRQHTPVDGSYRYSVDGGEIHRYIDNQYPDDLDLTNETAVDEAEASGKTSFTYYTTLWGEGGVYENSFIMDRNLGARGTSETEQGAGIYVSGGSTYGVHRYYMPGALYYQAGRKDPFMANVGKVLTGKDDDGNNKYEYLAFDSSSKRREYQSLSSSATACTYKFQDAVLRPTVYFCSSSNEKKFNWTDEEDANSLEFLWNDKYVANDVKTYFDITKKSIFDPSPLGWRMPLRGTWDNFNSIVGEDNPQNTYEIINTTTQSREYIQCGAIYPGSSGIMVSGNFFKTSFFETLSWSATPYDRSAEQADNANSFYSSYLGAWSGGVYPQGKAWHYRQIGMPVRPVKCQ